MDRGISSHLFVFPFAVCVSSMSFLSFWFDVVSYDLIVVSLWSVCGALWSVVAISHTSNNYRHLDYIRTKVY